MSRNYIQTIKAAPAEVHALICPVKEARWLDGWDCDLIFSKSGFEENFVKDMQFWEATLNHYLETGRPLQRPDREHWLKYESGKKIQRHI